MPDNLALDFPVLKENGGDFLVEISYQVEARQSEGKITIQHSLKGQSFIRRLLKDGDAKFSVLLFYKDNATRQNSSCDSADISVEDNEITATQIIPNKFSYAPEITPSIVILKDKEISVGDSAGLTDFWEQGECFSMPKFSRIALGKRLKFTTGDLFNLMRIECIDDLGNGEMKVVVNEYAGEGEIPVSLYCGRGVYDEIHKITPAEPSNAAESMRSAIITQALCAVYAYMANLEKPEDYESKGVLSAHLAMLEQKTGENWEEDPEFNPSLAATKMYPYVVTVLNGENDDA